VATIDGGTAESDNCVARLDLRHGVENSAQMSGAWHFPAGYLSAGEQPAPVLDPEGNAVEASVVLDEGEYVVVAVDMPKLRGNRRVVAMIHPRKAVDADGAPLLDARFSTNWRLRLLSSVVKALRERFADDVAMLVLPAGFFGYEGKVPVEARGDLVDTTIGRVLFYGIVPDQVPFHLVNRDLNKKALGELIDRCYRVAGAKQSVLFADALMQMGFTMANRAGISICIDDMKIPTKKGEILDRAFAEVRETEAQYNDGLITMGEKYNKVVDIWSKVTDEVSKELIREISTDLVKTPGGGTMQHASFNSIYMMVDSGARGSTTQIRQLAGMRGLMAKPDG
ncbi:MAG: hypothetical protein KDA28_05535, partial [Phycisphaerales bacterium]|nr:hypothetical protein [Phycisphaerales bacterium]